MPTDKIFTFLTHRRTSALGLITCLSLICAAFYFEYVKDMEPCPLCMAQRLVIYAAGAVFFVNLIANPQGWGQRVGAAAVILVNMGGAALAIRQLWLQSLPADQVPACGPGLDYMMEVLPWQDVVGVMLRGTGDCAEVHWVFLGLSIPGWTLVAFCCFILLGIWQYWHSVKQNDK